MPPIRPLSLATGIACIAATLAVLAGCGSSGAGSDTGTTTTPEQRAAASEGARCYQVGATSGGGFTTKYQCVAAKDGKKGYRWVLVEHGSPVPKKPGLMPDGTWDCTFPKMQNLRRPMIVRGDVYTMRNGITKYPHNTYGAGTGATPHGGTALAFTSRGVLADWQGEYVPAGSPAAVDGKDTMWGWKGAAPEPGAGYGVVCLK